MNTQVSSRSQTRIGIAWGIMLLVSLLPNVVWQETTHQDAGWLLWAKLGLLAVVVIASLVWKQLQGLRHFAIILITLFIAEELLFGVLERSALWSGWFGSADAPFTTSMLNIQLRRFSIALIIIAALRLLGYRRREFFLVPGDLDAPMRPVPWLGFPKPDPWTNFGGQFSLYISLGTLVFLVIGGRPSPASLMQAVPMLPAVLLFATLNAFSEEVMYRASLIATLEAPLGGRQALWLAAVFFGIGHYYGVPYGIVGVVMATFLGWMMGKAMVETRGFFWAWFIHFLQDVLIFTFMAIGSITPGG